MKIVSKRERMVGIKSMFSSALESSQRPKIELAAARTEHLKILRINSLILKPVRGAKARFKYRSFNSLVTKRGVLFNN